MTISKEDMNKLATLARLRFSDEEFDEFMGDMDDIIAFADTINNSVVGGTDEIKNVGAKTVLCDELREDEVKESLPNEKILSNVNGDKGYFVVKKVVKTGH
jgi:aspartyl-tRNA(Asn)/glutamyl-tRNA(Gln) amidotransferase subunit C